MPTPSTVDYRLKANGDSLAETKRDATNALVAQLIEEMGNAWRQGQYLAAEEFLARHPQLRDQPEAAVRIIYEEICLRQELGQEAATVEFIRRFPQWQAQLEVLLDCHRLMQPRAAAPDFPEVGETLGDFRLLALLGRGALGRVFLANQSSFADRPMVLKVTPRDDHEYLSLARLQHAHIVPLYAVQDFPARNLLMLCMPYHGGTTWARLLEMLAGRPPTQRTGQHLLQALDQAQAGVPVALSVKGPVRQLLAGLSYVQVVCWMGACLADALQYAHERGLIHLDLKPSNVLLAVDGQPMLLDFHLAREPIPAGGPAPELLGGTPNHMSPEQQAALAAVCEGRPISATVDGRSDIYSLGLLLYEALGGKIPVPAERPPRSLHECNPQVSVGLSDMVAKCLALEPGNRYPTAGALAADLRRHLNHAPLHGVSNRSPVERWRKWRRRRPYSLALVGMLIVVLTAGALAFDQLRQRHQQAENALADGQKQLQDHQHGEAVRTLNRGLSLTHGIPGSGHLKQALDQQLRLAQRAHKAHDLHIFADRVRFLVDVDSLPPGKMRTLETAWPTVWDARDRLTDPSGAELEPEVEQRIRTDLLDLAVLWAGLRVRSAPGNESRREALQVLAEAEALFGPSPILYRERQVHAEALGLAEAARSAARRASELAPRTPWDHYALGRSLLRSGNLEEAARELERAVNLQPEGFWPHFYRGRCAHRLGRYADAVTAFSVCVALAPASAECYYNRALAHADQDEPDRALGDYNRALQLDSTLAAAFLNRGILHYRADHHAEAQADFQKALNSGADPATAHYNLALVHLAQKNRPAAREHAQRALQHNREHPEASELCDRLQRER